MSVREEPTPVVISNGGKTKSGKPLTLGRWTFEYPPARRVVEDHLTGRVLNACAGKTKLNHDGEIVRNDLNPERDAEYHLDVAALREEFPPQSFDTVVFDPPFDDTQADDKYDGLRADSLVEAFRQFNELVRPGGVVISLGWNSWGMTSHGAFSREHVYLLQRGPCLRDVIVTVDKRTSGAISDV